MPHRSPRLPRDFYARNTVVVARDMLGKLLFRRTGDGVVRGGRVVETEAYHGPRDKACHAAKGRTPRTAPMFGPPGHAYVYQIYGMYHCLNTVTMDEDFPAAVLVRALEPVPGHPMLDDSPRAAAGPGKLCRALAIDRALTGVDLVDGPEVWLADDGFRVPRRSVRRGPRIGVDYAGSCAGRPWRFWIDGHRDVSRKVK